MAGGAGQDAGERSLGIDGYRATASDTAADDPLINLYASSRPRLRSRSGTVASTISTLILVGRLVGLLVGFLASPWARTFRQYFLNPDQMWLTFIGDPSKGILSVGKGFLINI